MSLAYLWRILLTMRSCKRFCGYSKRPKCLLSLCRSFKQMYSSGTKIAGGSMSRPSISYLDSRGFQWSCFWTTTFLMHSVWATIRQRTRLQDLMFCPRRLNNEIWHYWQIWHREVVEEGWQEMTEQFNLGAGVSWSEKTWQAQHTLLPTPKATNMSVFPEKSAMWKQKCLAVGSGGRLREERRGRELWKFNLGERSTRSQSQRTLTEDDISFCCPSPTHTYIKNMWTLSTAPSCTYVRHFITILRPPPVCLEPQRKSQRAAGKFVQLWKGQKSCHAHHHRDRREEKHLYLNVAVWKKKDFLWQRFMRKNC